MRTAELARIARDAIPPAGATGVCAVIDHRPGATPGTGTTRYGVAWITGWRDKSEPFVLFERMRDAFALIDLLGGELGRYPGSVVPSSAHDPGLART